MSAGRPLGDLPRAEYAFPGPLREQLVAAILDGSKTSTSALVEGYRREGERIPQTGDLEVVIDSAGRDLCVTRVAAVEVCRLADVTDEHARAEGEGYVDAAAWRAGHCEFWTSEQVQEEFGDRPVPVDADTEVVCVRFEVIERL